MKRIAFLLICLVYVSFNGIASVELPKKCQGTYQGVVPAHTVSLNNSEFTVSESDVVVSIDENTVNYTSGKANLSGTYTIDSENEEFILVKTTVNNGGSIKIDMLLKVFKKDKKIIRIGEASVPDTELWQK